MKRPTRPATPPAVKPHRPVKMWATRDLYYAQRVATNEIPVPVLVIPLTPESIEAMREKMDGAAFELLTGNDWKNATPIERRIGRERSEIFLRAISPHLAPRTAQQPTTTAGGTRRGRK